MLHATPAKTAVVILAGGRATRLPRKLERDFGGVPLLVRVYRNLEAVGPVYVSANAPLDALIDAPCIPDAVPNRGPLGAIVSVFERISEERAFVVAGDVPFVDHAIFERLNAAFAPGMEAAVPIHGDTVEPLCAVYDRRAFLREGRDAAAQSRGVRFILDRLRAHYVRFSDRARFASINTAEDLADASTTLGMTTA